MAKTQNSTKKLFKTEDFLAILGKSRLAQDLNPADYYVLFNLAFETSNENVKVLFDILSEEDKRRDHIEKTFEKLVHDAITDFENGVTEVKMKAKVNPLEDSRAEDTEKAENLLKQIN